MVHLRNSAHRKTYVPVSGFGERPQPVVPQWILSRTRKDGSGRSLKSGVSHHKTWSKYGPGTSFSTPSQQVYDQSYFSISAMKNKPRLALGEGWSLTGGGALSSGADKKPLFTGVLPRVTGTSINHGASPRSARSCQQDLGGAGYMGEEDGQRGGYLDNLESVSMVGASYPGGRAPPQGREHREPGDTQSVTTLDGVSVIADHTVEDPDITLPFQVTFTKATPRHPPTVDSVDNRSRSCVSPKSVRFSLPGNGAATPDDVLPEGQGSAGGAKGIENGGSVVDGFFVQSTPPWPLSAASMNLASSTPTANAVHGSAGAQSFRSASAMAMSHDKLVVGSVPSSAPPTCASPTAIMRSRGALCNSRQIPGRYFPPLALSEEHHITPSVVPPPLSSPRRHFQSSTYGVTSGSVRSAPPARSTSASASVVSAPPNLGTASIDKTPKDRNIQSFAVTSSYSWVGKGSAPTVKTKYINNNITTQPPSAQQQHQEEKRRAARARAMGMGPIGYFRPHPLDQINCDTVRDTVYNRNKKGFWELYDADPARFTFKFRAEDDPSGSTYDPTNLLQSDYYCLRKSHDVPSRSESARVKKKPGSPFQGCLEGTTKRLHDKAPNGPTFMQP